MSAPASAPAAAPALPAWSSVPYLLQQYYHDDPKKLNDFRLCELDALAELAGAPRVYTKSEVLYSSPFLRARFPSEAHLMAMAKRGILVTRWCELWADGLTLEDCLADFATCKTEQRINDYVSNAALTYDVRVHTFGQTPSQETIATQRNAVLAALGLSGILQSGSNVVAQKFFLFVDTGSKVVNPSRVVRRFYLCRVVADEEVCTLSNDYRLNARTFIGPTSMPANLSFIMSNLGLVTKNSVVYDPFVGTGSLLVSAGHFGALCVGSDLDWKILHGRTKKGPISVRDNFKQYKLKQPEIICSDLSVNMFRQSGQGFVDAIVCDPPYGVRAGARKSGRAEGKEVRTTTSDTSSHVPTTQIYDVEDVIHDLLDLSAQLLRIGGRLIYWLPTTTDFRNSELPPHPCLRQVSVSEQVVRSHFSRRLITMEKHLEFTPERCMHRRDKIKDPPPKYANLRETIEQLCNEGPDRAAMDTTGGEAAAAGSGSSSPVDDGADAAASFDPTSSFAPRPLSRSTLKRLQKLDNVHARKQRELEENGGQRMSRKERLAAKERMPAAEWKAQQKERNMLIHDARKQNKRNADGTSADAPPTDETSSAIEELPTITEDAAASSSTAAPASPPITQATKKARVDTGEETN